MNNAVHIISPLHQLEGQIEITIQKDDETGGRTERALTGAEYTITRL